jgi:3-mercaptopropionate dioxygenase
MIAPENANSGCREMPKQTRDAPLRIFVDAFAALLNQDPDEPTIIANGGRLLTNLVEHDNWLDPAFAKPHPTHYQQYLLHCDGSQRFCVVAFVWGPDQSTPIHNHTVWGLVGMLRGMEVVQRYELNGAMPVPVGAAQKFHPGEVEAVSPRLGDIHQVSNGLADQPSISIHVYGANIGAVRRSSFRDGQIHPFVSGYANEYLPNIWGPTDT